MRKKIAVAILSIILMTPLVSVEAITLGEYESKLNAYIKEVNNTKAAINKTEGEINAANQNISNIKEEIKSMGREVQVLREEVAQFEDDIVAKDAETKKIVEYYQLSKSANSKVLEYAFGADNVTDLIYRLSVVEQLIEYNDEKVNELGDMIEENNKREVEINKTEKRLEEKELYLQDQVVSLGEERSSLQTAGVTAGQQVKIYQEIVTSYKKLGCKSSDRIGIDCATSGDSGIFRRPTATGYITQEFGYTRPGYLHRGIDIGSSMKERTALYSIGSGRITSIYRDVYGALCLTIEYYSASKGTYYTALYAHLSRYGNIYVGQKVTSNTIVGYMGNTGKSSGVHLHIEIIPCRLYNMSDSKCSSWSRYTNYVASLAKNGYKAGRAVISFPARRVTWNSR